VLIHVIVTENINVKEKGEKKKKNNNNNNNNKNKDSPDCRKTIKDSIVNGIF